jgi:PPOX class probable F420-dependent enzyme
VARKIATNTHIDREALFEFVRPRHRMVLITQRSDGTPQASPVTGGIDDSDRIVISTYPDRAKTRNVRSRPDGSVLVICDDWNDAWVQVDGIADIADAHEDLEPFVEYYRNIAGEHPDWAEYRQAMLDQGKSLIRVTPSRWGPVATGGFPARLA